MYRKMPMWQWIIMYVVIGGLIYAALYYFVFSKNGSNGYGASTQPNYTTTAPTNY